MLSLSIYISQNQNSPVLSKKIKGLANNVSLAPAPLFDYD